MKKFSLILIFLAVIASLILANHALADVTLKGAGPAANIPSGETGVATIVGNIIKGVLGFAGAVMLLLFIYGGILWLTSAGSSEKIERGKNTLVWAIIGFIVMIGSYVATDFVITALVGSAPATPAPASAPPPSSPPPTNPTGCLSGAAKNANGCCEEFSAYADGSNCSSATSSGIYRCCDCGKTQESTGFQCVKGTQSNLQSQGYTIISGHCGTSASWWCAKK